MIVAALCGICSAMLVNKDPNGSNILNAISVHLFAFEAIFIIINRVFWNGNTNHHRSIDKEQQEEGGGGANSSCVTKWTFIADISFFLGTRYVAWLYIQGGSYRCCV
jgi:hypothetical protein